ncbi:MAG: response regulator [Sulfurovum sp.]
MNFDKLKELLINDNSDIIDVHDHIKDATGAKSIDILFYNQEQKLFFDKINNINIQLKYLDEKSIIGSAFINRVPYFILDIINDTKYNLAIDNPFKLEIDNQVVIPILSGVDVKGIVRLSQLPLAFDEIDFADMIILNEPFGLLFGDNENIESENEESEVFVDRLAIFNTITEIKKLLNILSQNSKNQEVEKLIEYGRDNINNIFTYINPSLKHITKVKKELVQVQNLHSKEKNINILIADDVKINVNILKAMLSTNKQIDKIKLAYDGIETIDVIENCVDCKDNIHIIFLDHHMPGVLGTDIARQIRAKERKHHEIIIVSITNDIEIMEANKDIYDYHLPKPFTRDNINKIMDMIKEVNKL